MPNDDGDLIDPQQTPKRPESGSVQPDPILAFLLALVAIFIAFFLLLAAARGRPVGIPMVVMVGYTFMIAFIAYRFRVPRLARGKFLLGHCLALAIVYLITTKALGAYSHLPTWFTAGTGHRGGSFFTWCLAVIFLVLAVCEYSWGLRDEGEEAAEAERSGIDVQSR
jgi:hypothetical protein